MTLKEISEEQKKDPIISVLFVRKSGKKYAISISVYHEVLERISEDILNEKKKI